LFEYLVGHSVAKTVARTVTQSGAQYSARYSANSSFIDAAVLANIHACIGHMPLARPDQAGRSALCCPFGQLPQRAWTEQPASR
jgi:hypothetical protein